ncbi:MAG: hypothetical protein KDB53_11035, partial [Planctomycetes bacterium]|nr:hypothetical protein [Planctomycetota bacterium]
MSLTEEKALPSTVLEVSEDGLATLVLAGQGDRPFILDRAAVEELEERVEELGRRAEVRGLMIVGAGGRVFCAGADVDAISGLTNADEARAISQQGQ